MYLTNIRDAFLRLSKEENQSQFTYKLISSIISFIVRTNRIKNTSFFPVYECRKPLALLVLAYSRMTFDIMSHALINQLSSQHDSAKSTLIKQASFSTLPLKSQSSFMADDVERGFSSCSLLPRPLVFLIEYVSTIDSKMLRSSVNHVNKFQFNLLKGSLNYSKNPF